MSLINTKGNLLDKGYDVVLHQANCLNIMGGGIAREIRLRFPGAFEADRNFPFRVGEERLGKFSYSKEKHDVTDKEFYIMNVYGQCNINGKGPKYDGVLTDYPNLEKGIRDSIAYMKAHYDVTSFGVPYLMGCALAKGDWTKVEKILTEISNDLEVDIFVSEFTP